MSTVGSFDFVVVGAGVFGAWTAYHLQQFGRVILLDAHGAANSRSSSGGESRIIRTGYGADDLYTRWSAQALQLWQVFCERVGKRLFHRTGVLWLVRQGDDYTRESLATMQRSGITAEQISRVELQRRYPQFSFDDVSWGLLESDSGVILAREAVQTLLEEETRAGISYLQEAVVRPVGKGRLEFLRTNSGTVVNGGNFVFACGPWLPALFPDLLKERMFITRQEVFFFGAPAGTQLFAPPAMPVWLCLADQVYGMPNLASRGLKLAFDYHGPEFDPECGLRVATSEGLQTAREYLGKRFPQLKHAPVLETRVCQYENTSNGDFLIDRHPEFNNVWLVGGGSGHGFKHGPVVGEYVANLVVGRGIPEPRFSLGSKSAVQNRTVF